MSVSNIDTTHQILEHASRAWFPDPEFRVSVSHDMNTFSTHVRVLHREAQWYVSQLIDVDMLEKTKIQTVEFLDHVLESLAHQMHGDLALRGFGKPFAIRPGGPIDFTHRDGVRDWYAKEALFDLMGLKLVSRECQGSIGEEGIVLYLVKPDAWVRRIGKGMLDLPLEWWTDFIRGLTASHAREPE